jgi:hypothetical protein
MALFYNRIAISCWVACCLWIASASGQAAPQSPAEMPSQAAAPARLPEGNSSVPAPPLNLTDNS